MCMCFDCVAEYESKYWSISRRYDYVLLEITFAGGNVQKFYREMGVIEALDFAAQSIRDTKLTVIEIHVRIIQ